MQLKVNANKLKQLRESRCWSQQQLADMSGLSLRTVQRIEAKSVASQESIKCLGAVFDIQIAELFDDIALENTTLSDSAVMSEETPPSSSLANNNCHDGDQTAHGEQEIKRLHIAFIIVIASHLFGFYGIFSAFDAHRIDTEAFQLLKNSLSIVLVFSALVYFLKYTRLKKKYGLGSSLL